MMSESRLTTIKRVSIVSALMNALLAVYKMVVGWLGMSPALFADGIHSLSDLLCDGMVYLAGHYAHQDPDHDHPYGHWRYETFATIALSIFLILLGLGIVYDAIEHLLRGTTAQAGVLTIWAALLSVLTNEWLFRFTLRAARIVKSEMLEANAYHSRGDSLSSVIVLIGLVASYFGLHAMDALAAMIVGFFIIKMGANWSRRALHELSEGGVDDEQKQAIIDTIAAQAGVCQFHMLRTRRLGSKVFLDVHINIDYYASASEGHFIGEQVRYALAKAFDDMEDITVHIDTEDHPEGIPESLLPSRQALLAELMPQWQALLPADAIKRITLHYLNQHIELELWLDAKVLKRATVAQWQKRLHKTIAAMPVVSTLRVMVG